MEIKKNIFSNIKAKQWKTVIAFVLFCVIGINIFLKITYIFRNTSYDRIHITGIKEISNIDVAYIGGSAAFVYWRPPDAWSKYGITSYNFATNTIQAETIKGQIKEVLKFHKPELFIIDARPFQYWTEEISEPGIRNVTDGMDYSINRFLTVADAFKHKEIEENEKGPYYFDIAKYHNNLDNLKNPSAWYLKDNEKPAAYNGWEFIYLHETLQEPNDGVTEEEVTIPEGSKAVLEDTLEFCQKEKLNVLFVVCPYYIDLNARKQYNYIGNIVKSYGMGFLNANNYYDNMKLDFSMDFYNVNHVNVYGAEKYTRFLSEYIIQNYKIPDRRNKAGSESWNNISASFYVEDRSCKKEIKSIIKQKEEAYQNGLKLKNITNPYEWSAKVQDGNYYILAESQGKGWTQTTDSNRILSQFNIPADNMANAIRVYNGTEAIYANDGELDENFKGIFSGHSDFNQQYEINCGTKAGIIIDGKEYCKQKDGLNIAIYDKNYRKVLDFVSIIQNADGEIEIVR